jgi:hypothetical protein
MMTQQLSGILMTTDARSHANSAFFSLTALPAGYKLIRRLEIESARTFWALNVAALIPFAISFWMFSQVDRLLSSLYTVPEAGLVLGGIERIELSLLAIVLVIAMLSVHELCHGLAYRIFGAKPRYGVNLRKWVAYASAENYYLSRNAYIVVALAPLVILSLATLIGMALTGGIWRLVVILLGAANAGGAIGDLWFTWVCLRSPSTLLIRDFGDGAELYAPESLRDAAQHQN